MGTDEMSFNVGENGSYKKSNRKIFIIFAVVLLIGIIIAFVIGFHVRKTKDCKDATMDASTGDVAISEEQKKFFKKVTEAISTVKLKENLNFFAGKPHAAATAQNNKLIEEIYNRFQSYNFVAEYFKYDVLLSYPDLKKRNYVYVIKNDSGEEIFQSKGIEDFLEPKENDSSSLPPFNAYSPNGTVKGELIYVNYGRFEDFEELENKYKVNVSGKIVIVRYGKIFRGDKVANAQDRGAIGVIIYNDPFDYAPVPDNQTFPKGRWLPADGVQRGSIIKSNYKDIPSGDPLTGSYPAKAWLYHEDPSDLKGLPRIPTQPISAYDAYELFKRMGGQSVDKNWTGRFNVSYKIGPFIDSNEMVKVKVNNKLETRTITNVCGTIKGAVEPDRYVLMGNHIDAWVAGAVDPSSGTTVMMEVARVLSEMIKSDGWKPRRTIKFCGWDGEEQNIIGSCEYVEEFKSQLRDRAVAYINVDSAVSGNESLGLSSSPVLHKMLFDISKLVEDPLDDMTVFEKSKKAYPDPAYPNLHRIGALGSGSDFFAFYQFIGVPSIDMGYGSHFTNKKLGTAHYPVYHSLHDTVYWMEHFVDRDYKVHRAVAQVAMYCMLYMADIPLLPFDNQRYGEKLVRDITDLTKQLKDKGSETYGVSTEHMLSAANNFSEAVKSFQMELDKFDKNNPLELRMLNDRLIQVEKGFIYPPGLPGRPEIKHYVMAPSLYNMYGSSSFPAISDLLYDIKKTNNWNEVKKQISISTYLVQAVADSLLKSY